MGKIFANRQYFMAELQRLDLLLGGANIFPIWSCRVKNCLFLAARRSWIGWDRATLEKKCHLSSRRNLLSDFQDCWFTSTFIVAPRYEICWSS